MHNTTSAKISQEHKTEEMELFFIQGCLLPSIYIFGQPKILGSSDRLWERSCGIREAKCRGKRREQC